MTSAIRPVLIPLVIIATILLYFLLQNAIVNTPSIPHALHPVQMEAESDHEVDFMKYAKWKELLMRILEAVRDGKPLSQEQIGILEALRETLAAYPASVEAQVLEILGIIDIIFETNEELLRRNPDHGQHRTDNDP